jgi:hypothetical protein
MRKIAIQNGEILVWKSKDLTKSKEHNLWLYFYLLVIEYWLKGL